MSTKQQISYYLMDLHPGKIAALIIISSTVIGFFGILPTGDPGVMSTWFFAGVALAVVYLLSIIANNSVRTVDGT